MDCIVCYKDLKKSQIAKSFCDCKFIVCKSCQNYWITISGKKCLYNCKKIKNIEESDIFDYIFEKITSVLLNITNKILFCDKPDMLWLITYFIWSFNIILFLTFPIIILLILKNINKTLIYIFSSLLFSSLLFIYYLNNLTKF